MIGPSKFKSSMVSVEIWAVAGIVWEVVVAIGVLSKAALSKVALSKIALSKIALSGIALSGIVSVLA